MTLALTYQTGDIVAATDRFEKCGRVIDASSDGCNVNLDHKTVYIPEQHLALISIKNNPNLRLVANKINEAGQQIDGFSAMFSHEVIAFASGGSIIGRAFADYVSKIPVNILTVALDLLCQTRLPMPEAVDRVMNLNFELLSGR
ncbi:MAG: hypothetical protein ACFE0J_25050 [Elainellaceae cyanobacterium]